MTATERLLDALRQTGTVRGSGRTYTATCPAHEDRSPSLSVTSAETRVLIKCQAGCETDDVLAALDLTRSDLFDEPLPRSDQAVASTYDYTDEAGKLLFQVVRTLPKSFRQRRPDGAGWTWNLNGTRRVPYRLPEVVAAVRAGREVYVVEGEKDADRLASAGLVATCNPGGAGKWRPEYGDVLAGADVVLVADRDVPGYAHARQVAADLAGRAKSVRLVEPVEGKDVSDHLAAGRGVDELVAVSAAVAEEDAEEAALDAAAAFAREVAVETYRLRVRETARDKLATERLHAVDLPTSTRLDEFLSVPDEPTTHRIDGLWPTGGRVVLSAPHKAGKSTLVGNLTRSLVDDQPFLDAFGVQQAGRVVIIDNELDERMLRRWLRDQGIERSDRVTVLPLRGRLSSFNILDAETRQRWADHIGSGDVLILDCLRPALDALALSEDKDAGRFLEALDELTTLADIGETFVVHHMGHIGERSRGDSRILDWPDAVWNLVKDAEDDDEESVTTRRYLSAYGRDVDMPETLLTFAPTTRRLSVGGGSRKETRAEGLLSNVLDYLADHPDASKNAVEKAVEGRAESVRKALNLAVERGLVERRKEGPAVRHRLNLVPSSHLVPDEWTNPYRDLVPSSIGRGRGRDTEADQSKADLVPDEPTPQTRPCAVCREPMRPITPDQTTHPLCEPMEES